MGALSDSIGAGGGGITIEEVDGSPSIAAATVLKFPNNSLTAVGTTVSVDEYPAPLGVNGANLASFAPYLRAGYTFNDASSSLTDSVGVPHDMAQVGTSPTYLQAGKNGTAIRFGSGTSYFERPPSGFSPGTSEYTLNWWVYKSWHSPWNPELIHWYSPTGTQISVNASTWLQLKDGVTTNGSITFPVNTWVMVTWQRIKDGGTYYNRIFQDGVQVINKADVVPDLADRTLRVGGSLADSSQIVGDELLYYTGPDGYGAISAAAILELWNSSTGIFLSTVGTPTGLGFSHADLVGYNSYLHDYWKFEESGTPLIDAISNNSLAATGSPTYGITGKNNNCVQLHVATLDYMTRTASFAHANNQEYTLSFWVYFDSLPTTFFFDWYINTGSFIRLATGSGGGAAFYRNGPGTTISSGAGVLGAFWTHVVLVKTETAGPLFAVSMYCNGVLIGTETPTAASGHLAANTGEINFGRTGHPSLSAYTLDGKFDEACYWKGVSLDSAAVTALYNAGTGRFLESI